MRSAVYMSKMGPLDWSIPENLQAPRLELSVTRFVMDPGSRHHFWDLRSDAMLHGHLQPVHGLHKAGGSFVMNFHVSDRAVEQAFGSIESACGNRRKSRLKLVPSLL